MIAAVRGTLEHKTLDSALIALGGPAGGVTLRVFAPLSTLNSLEVGATVRLYTYLLVREDVLALYGFATEGDRAMFEQLLAVGGIGPRTALAMLSAMSAQALAEAILTEDVARLTHVPGVGKKTAARLVLELRPAMEKLAGTPAGVPGVTPAATSQRAQVLEALTGLGYTPTEASAALRALPEDAAGSLEDLILQALRSLARE
jgi:Holliday junction DNA helicase RuvA